MAPKTIGLVDLTKPYDYIIVQVRFKFCKLVASQETQKQQTFWYLDKFSIDIAKPCCYSYMIIR